MAVWVLFFRILPQYPAVIIDMSHHIPPMVVSYSAKEINILVNRETKELTNHTPLLLITVEQLL